MGSCLSKKTTTCSSSTTALPDPPDQKSKPIPQPQVAEKKKSEEDNVKKEIFLIKHRISHDSDRKSDEEKPKSDPKCANTHNSTPSTITATTSEAVDVGGNLMNGGVVVRTSSCSKEEIDAILIQCGRFSRSSSTGKAAAGRKRSYDFDQEKGNGNDNDDDDDAIGGGDDEVEKERTHRHRHRHRLSSPSSSSSGRRRTPSRERDQQNQRSGSRERGSGSGGGGGRRVSRSPGKRSESPITTNTNTTTTRPGKMVSVPATVSSMTMDKSGIGGGGGVEPPSATAIKRISAKRNVGAASPPRARSPAATSFSNEKQNPQTNQPLSLSRSNSRKAEHSPYRRNPLGEIDQNCIEVNKASTNIVSQAPIQKPNTDSVKSNKNVVQGTDNKTISVKAKQQQQQQKINDEGKPLHPNTGNVTVTMVPSGPESLKPQTVTRTRSLGLSQGDVDFNPETLLNPSPTSSYTALLLEDIQNFHQKGTAGMSLPPCLTKACSILEAVADLNSTTISNLSTCEQFGKKKRLETKEPFLESEVIGGDDLMEPSFHKYVTVSRGGGGGDMEEVESSGSNSFISGGQNWVSSSVWEHNSANSTDSWNPLRLGEKKIEGDQKHKGIGRRRVGSGRDLQSTTRTLKTASS